LAKWGKTTTAPLPLVDLGPLDYMVGLLFDAGPTSAGMQETRLQWAELDAFARLSGEITEDWEAPALMAMSRAYLKGKTDGADPFKISPIERAAADDR
jgi:hypothetical protein